MMLKTIRYYTVMILLAFSCRGVYAQDVHIFDTLKATVYFRGGSADLDYDYRDNGLNLFHFIEKTNALQNVSKTNLYMVKCFAATTLDDFLKAEKIICDARNNSVKKVLDRYLSVKPEKIKMYSVGLNWREVLIYVAENDIPYRKEIEKIIRSSPEKMFEGDTLADSYIFKLMELDRGTVWKQLKKGCFENMNMVELWCIYERNIPAEVQVIPPKFSDLHPVEKPSSGTNSGFSMSVRTNLLSDVALIPSIGLDFFVGHNFSIAGQWGYSYWTLNDQNRMWKYYGGDLAVRWWFGRKRAVHPLTGHHVGPYGQMAAFDFATGANRFSGPRWWWAAGIEYGYSIPFKGKNVSIDFSIGIGYANGTLNTWYLKTNEAEEEYYEWNAMKKIQYIGPTKAEISLIWLLGGWSGKSKKE